MSVTPVLFQPTKIGQLSLQHRVVHAPVTRLRTTPVTNIPVVPLVKEYYSQRSRVPGTLLISEGSIVAPKASGVPHLAGIWSDEQIAAWKEITDEVHRNGSFIFVQIGAMGRQSDPQVLAAESPDASSPFPFVAPSPIPIDPTSHSIPRELSKEEIKEYIDLYAQAAINGVEKAGFDGVEIHAVNGGLADQFLQDISNQRTDEYGGNVENRSRFTLELVDALVNAVGEDRTAVRLSPWNRLAGMGMKDPIPQFSHLVSELKERHPDLAYLHAVEPRVADGGDADQSQSAHADSNDFLRDIWAPRPFISAGGYTRDTALEASERTGELIAFGRPFLANPDLPLRLKANIPLNKHNRPTFYVPGDRPDAHIGYIDYPFAVGLTSPQIGG